MLNALLNMVIGMGSVFIVLIIIALVISLFKYIPMIEEKLTSKKEATPKQPSVPRNQLSGNTEDPYEDLALVAVITAAIEAYTNMTSDEFVVKSIRRR